MIKVGRYTAGLLLLTVGGSILLEQFIAGDKLIWLFTWWPIFLIILGLEYLYYSSRYRKEERGMKLDVLGLMLSIIISVVIIGGTRAPAVINLLKDNNLVNVVKNELINVVHKEGEGQSFNKLYKDIPLEAGTKQIKLNNVSGEVSVRSGDVSSVAIQATIWVDMDSESDAGKVADQSQVKYTTGSTLIITAEGPEYSRGLGIDSSPRIDLIVTIPKQSQLELFEINLTHGTVQVDDLQQLDRLAVKMTNGEIKLTELSSSVQVDLVNGEVITKEIKGDLNIGVERGSIEVDQVYGNLIVNSTLAEVNVASNQVGGDWNVQNTLGEVILYLPTSGDYTVEGGALGEVNTDVPFTVQNQTIYGKIGKGTNQIVAHTTGELGIFQK